MGLNLPAREAHTGVWGARLYSTPAYNGACGGQEAESWRHEQVEGGAMYKSIASAEVQEALVLPPVEMPSALEEVHHRVANHLQLLEASVRFEAMRRDEPALIGVLAAISDRIAAIAAVHRHLYRSNDGGELLDLSAYVQELAGTIGRGIAFSSDGVIVDVANGRVETRAGDAALVGILLTELVGNACKHAYAPGSAGRVTVRLAPLGGGGYSLSVEDEGRGRPEDGGRRGLGTRLIDAITCQLGATYVWRDLEPGSAFILERR